MQTTNTQLIDELLLIIETANSKAKQFKELTTTQLNYKKSPESWSILECLEHLNLYGDFYLPEIQKQVLKAEKAPANAVVKSGVLGNYFASSMKVKNGKVNKMKTFKDKNPLNSQLSVTTIDRFLKQQQLLASLLTQSKTIDLNKTKTAITISSLIKLRLGDTFRFLVYHIERHMQQAERVLH
ncbi:MAG: DinB family protein [Bacteroidia bacterium]